MKKLLGIIVLAMITAYSCATPDTPKTEPNADTMHITPADTAKMKPDTTRM